MFLVEWYRKSRVSPEDYLRRRRRPSKVRFTPQVDVMEDRTLLSIVVTNTDDHGMGSLRQAIADADVPGETIDATQIKGTITLSSGSLVINKNLVIQGPDANRLTISGNDQARVFDVEGSGVSVTIAGLTIAHGNAQGGVGEAGRGGGILMESGTILTLTSSTLENNQAQGGRMHPARVVQSTWRTAPPSPLTTVCCGAIRLGVALPRSASSDPRVVDHGGGGAIVNNGGQLTIRGSVLTHNLATGGGGVIGGFGVGRAINNEAGATLTLASSTFTDNQAVGGRGDVINGSGYGGALLNLNATLITTAGSTQITGNRAGSDTTFGLGGGLFSLGGSVPSMMRSSRRTRPRSPSSTMCSFSSATSTPVVKA